jgi:hypothetical protein
MKVDIRFVHRTAPRDTDRRLGVELPDDCFEGCAALAKALRVAGLLPRGARIRGMRTEGRRLVAFPSNYPAGWHCLIFTPASLRRLTRLARFGRRYHHASAADHSGHDWRMQAVRSAARLAGPLSYEDITAIISAFGDAEEDAGRK